uniref:C-type lectin domain-containing protein n=1 Tax=Strigamia maritima TaxID=126957 RepID=T1JD99_STRMM
MKLVLLLLSVCVCKCFSFTCRDEFVKINDGCYHFSNEKIIFYDAIKRCRSMNAFLVSVETIQENFAIKLHLYYKQTNATYYWTSGTDAFHKGQHKWMSTLENMAYTDWCNTFTNTQNCIFISHVPNKATC